MDFVVGTVAIYGMGECSIAFSHYQYSLKAKNEKEINKNIKTILE